MPKGHCHPTRDERCQIGALKESGLSDGAIAARLGRDRTTVCRERHRKGGDGGYSHGNGQRCTSDWKWGSSIAPSLW